MSTQYTSLLGFALPVTGELNGTWGDVVNDSITQLVEDSVAGPSTADVTSGDWTLTTTGSGAANQARSAILIPTGSPGVSRNIIAPSSSKAYIVVNQSDAAVVVKGSATTGVSIAAGMKALVVWNGTDFVRVGSTETVGTSILYGNGSGGFSNVTIGSGVSFAGGTLSATGTGGTVTSVTGTSPVASSGGNTPAISLASAYGDTQNPYASKTANYVLAAPNGSAGTPTFRAIVAADIPTLNQNTTGTAAGLSTTLAVGSGGTGVTNIGTNRIPYGNGTSPVNTSANFTYDGTSLLVGDASGIGGATNPVIASVGGSNNYVQSYIYNNVNDANSSADFVAYPSNGVDSSGWIDIGITSLSFNQAAYSVTGPNEAYLFGSAPASSGTTGNLVYATDSTGTANSHQWYVGGFNLAKSAWKMQLTSSALQFNNFPIKNIKTATFNSQTTIATTVGSITVDWTSAQNQLQTEPTGTITYTFTAPPGPCHLQLIINSDGASTAQTINWPGSVTFMGATWSGVNNKKAVINFWYDGTNYIAVGTNQV